MELGLELIEVRRREARRARGCVFVRLKCALDILCRNKRGGLLKSHRLQGPAHLVEFRDMGRCERRCMPLIPIVATVTPTPTA